MYEGNFVGGLKDGEGVYIHKKDQSEYHGNFQTDLPSGIGAYKV